MTSLRPWLVVILLRLGADPFMSNRFADRGCAFDEIVYNAMASSVPDNEGYFKRGRNVVMCRLTRAEAQRTTPTVHGERVTSMRRRQCCG
jgi:hypothetical protein